MKVFTRSGHKDVIEVPLSTKGIDDALWELKLFRKRMFANMRELLDVMCREGEEYAINAVTHIDTGATVNSIHGYRNGNKGFIVAGGNAVWLEFGTGVYWNGNTNGSPHPKGAELGMIIGEYGDQRGLQQGWFYPSTDPRYEIVKTRADGTQVHTGYAYTHGIEATMFLWKTARELKAKCPEYAKQVFR